MSIFKGFKVSNTLLFCFSMILLRYIFIIFHILHNTDIFKLMSIFHPNAMREDMGTHLNKFAEDYFNKSVFCSYLGLEEMRKPMFRYTTGEKERREGSRKGGKKGKEGVGSLLYYQETGQTLVALPIQESNGHRVDKTRLILWRDRNVVGYLHCTCTCF